MHIYIGVDKRQWVAYTALAHSIVSRASIPVSITPLLIETLPIKRRGLTSFTFSRYLVPWLQRYEGHALFLDSDMLCLGDIAEIFRHADHAAVKLVQSKIHRFEWPSLMLFNCVACKKLTPAYIDDEKNQPSDLKWAGTIGPLPDEWNHLIGYDDPNPNAKILHFTQGIPFYTECRGTEGVDAWWDEFRAATGVAVSWMEIMGQSRHYTPVLERLKACASAS